MYIKKIKLENYGPFSTLTEILFHKDLTIFIGANDTGKSSVLRIINNIFTGTTITENEVNIDWILESPTPWKENVEIKSEIILGVTSLTNKYLPGNPMKLDDDITISVILAPEKYQRIITRISTKAGSVTSLKQRHFSQNPKVIYLHDSFSDINPIINLSSPKQVEEKFLTLAFGPNINQKLTGLSLNRQRTVINAGEKQLNKLIRELLPENMEYEVLIQKLDNQAQNQISVNLLDKAGGDVPINVRGAGVRKILSLLVTLLDRNLEKEFAFILIDEPENSLHADSQHAFRRFLENLGKKENIQIIYATHSPAMVNPLLGDRLRLFSRTTINGKATTVVENQPFLNNFLKVRTSLGMTPSDTLLYAPVVVVVEGATEVLAISKLFERLLSKNSEGYGNLDQIMSQIFIFDGNGDSFDKCCRLIEAQGDKPILFVDGDKIPRVKQMVEQGKLNNIPIIMLDEGKEIEDLVPRDRYFEYLAQVTGEKEITCEAFEKWNQTARLHEKMLFSKRVDRWLQDEFPEVVFRKQAVMQAVIEKVDLSEIDLAPFKQLVNEIGALLHRIHEQPAQVFDQETE